MSYPSTWSISDTSTALSKESLETALIDIHTHVRDTADLISLSTSSKVLWPGIISAYDKVYSKEDSYIHIQIRETLDTLETAQYLMDMLQDIFDSIAEMCQVYRRLPLGIHPDRAFGKDVTEYILAGRFSINRDTTATPGYTGSGTAKYREDVSTTTGSSDWRVIFGTTTSTTTT